MTNPTSSGDMNSTGPVPDSAAVPIVGHIAHSTHGFCRVPAHDVNGTAIFQGDIVLGRTADMERVEAACQATGHTHFDAVPLADLPPAVQSVILPTKPWPKRTIRYTIDASLTETENVEAAITAWEDAGAFRFDKLGGEGDDPPDGNYVEIRRGSISQSPIGMVGNGRQPLELQDNYSKGVAIHELGHAIGLIHEQSAPEAASFVEAVWSNIQQNQHSQFGPKVGAAKVGHYDYSSVMHYPATSFAIDPRKPTLIPYDANVTIGQRKTMSVRDLSAAQAMYGDLTVQSVQVRIKTGATGTDGWVYLGMGGREFALDTDKNNYKPHADETFVLGKNANIKVANRNDPRSPALTLRQILSQPTYVRHAGTPDWDLTSVTVTIGALDPAWDPVWDPAIGFGFRPGSVALGPSTGRILRLERIASSQLYDSWEGDRSIQSIKVTVKTGTTGTDSPVYLGAGGREFRMDTEANDYEPNSTSEFVLGQDANIKNSAQNDPRAPVLCLSNLNSNPLYIRQSGEAAWDIQSVEATVTYASDTEVEPAPVTFNLAPATTDRNAITFGREAGARAYLRHSNRVTADDQTIRKITVTVKVGSNGTDDPVFLGVAGREFRLNTTSDDFEGNESCVFILGEGATVVHPTLNDPRHPACSLLDARTCDTYLRKDGTDGLSIESASVVVIYGTKGAKRWEGHLEDVFLDDDCGMLFGLSSARPDSGS